MDATPGSRALRDALLSLGEGASFVLRDRRARALLLLPGLIALAAGIAFLAAAARGFDLLGEPLVSPVVAAADAVGLGPPAWCALAGLYFAASAVLSLSVSALLTRSLLDRIARRAEEDQGGGGALPPRPPAGEGTASIPSALLGASRSHAVAFALAPIGLVPLLGPGLLLASAAWATGSSPLERTMERRGIPAERRRALLAEHRAAVLGFGLAAVAAAAVPILGGLLALPAVHAGAPRLLDRLLAREAPDCPSL